MKRFKILDTNVEKIKDTHFLSQTNIGVTNEILGGTYRCFMFDGLRIKLIKEDQYILGELHG